VKLQGDVVLGNPSYFDESLLDLHVVVKVFGELIIYLSSGVCRINYLASTTSFYMLL
jgi:hypothetical protein